MVLVRLKNISKSFGNKTVLKGLSLDLDKGEIMGLIGRSGCGKSTLIKILVGYYRADSGQITFKGENIKDIVGYTTQENSFYEKLTVMENMRYYANLYSIKDQKKLNSLLRSVKLYSSRDKLAEDISGGMKRRLDFAISLIHDPQLVILDEPTTGLDPILVKNFWKIVKNTAKDSNISVLVSSHILSEIKENCTKAAVMHDGKISKVTDIKLSTDLEKIFRRYTR